MRSGRLRGLAVVAQERVAQLPEAPTFAQAGFPAVDSFAWFGLMAPAGTPREIVERLNLEVNAALKSAEVLEKFAGIGALAVGGGMADFERSSAPTSRSGRGWSGSATSSLTERSRGGPGRGTRPVLDRAVRACLTTARACCETGRTRHRPAQGGSSCARRPAKRVWS